MLGKRGVTDMIKEVGLLRTVCNLWNCYEKFVKEFLVNISEECDNPLSQEYQKVYVRGECVNFSPNIINIFLGIEEEGVAKLKVTDNQICREITANQVRVWPKKGKISSGKLSLKYASLNRITASNLVPTTHLSNIAIGLGKFIYSVGTRTRMNIRKYVFKQTIKHAKTDAVKFPIAFPTLLCNIMIEQHPSLSTLANTRKKRESPRTLHYKLFGSNHVPGIVGTSGDVPIAVRMTRQDIVAALKVCDAG